MKKQNPATQTAIDYLHEQLGISLNDVDAERKQFKKTNASDMEHYALDQLKQNRAIVLTIQQNGLLNDICLAYIFDNKTQLSTNVKLEHIINAMDEAGFNMEAIKKIIKASCAEHQGMILSAFEKQKMDKIIAVEANDTKTVLF